MTSYTTPSDSSLFTHLLADSWATKAQTPKPTAAGTMLRYSGAHGCGRRMGYDWFDAHYSDPPTAASIFQAGVGTLVGEAAADAMIARYGGVAELPSKVNEWISGSADWFALCTPLGSVVYEHKMKSSYAFNKALGYKRNFGRVSLVDPEGAPSSAIAQAGMNALGIERSYDYGQVDAVVVGVVSTDIVSVTQNKSLMVNDFARFGAEWNIPREIWESAALSEISRLSEIAEAMDLGYLSDRVALDDDSKSIFLSPGSGQWQCDYCPYQKLCYKDGKGQLRVLDSKLTKRNTDTEKDTQ